MVTKSTTRHAVALLGLALCLVPGRASAQRPVGVVVTLGEVDGARALRAARRAGGASYRVESIVPQHTVAEEPPTDALAQLRARYLEADFTRCLSSLQDPRLSPDRLLESGARDAAAQVAVFGAACAFGADDHDLARHLLRQAHTAELDMSSALEVTTPDFQTLSDEIRARVLSTGRVRVTFQTRPASARLEVDGGAHRCRSTPCEVTVIPGEHQITADALGHTRRTMERSFGEDEQVRLALDPAPAPLLRTQIGEAVSRGSAPDTISFLRAAAMAFEARVVVLSWQSGGRARAAVYDRSRDRVVARTSAPGDNATGTTIRAAITEWRGEVEPTPLYEEPLFWAGTVGAAVATGLAVYFLVRPADARYDIRFFQR